MTARTNFIAMVPDDETPRSEGTLNATGEERDSRPSSSSIDEEPLLKPKGGKGADVAGSERRKLSCTSKLRVGTWNVRSLYEGKMEVILREMMRTNISLLGLSEVRWTGGGHFTSGEYRIYFSGNETSRANGVAVVCHKSVAACVMGYDPVSDRIMTIRVRGKPINMTVIQIYAPTTAAVEECVEGFYEQLQKTIDSIPKGDAIIIMGDMNAKVGEGTSSQAMGRFGLGERNDAGDRLIEFCEINNLGLMNTFFPQPKRRLYTWTSPDGKHRNQIDYIMCNNRWRSAIQAMRTLPGADCGTDHELLMAEIRVKLRKSKRKCAPTRYDMERVSEGYRVDISNRFRALDLLSKEPDEIWLAIKNAMNLAAEEHIPRVQRKRRVPWISDEAIAIAKERREAKAQGGDQGKVRSLNCDFQRQVRRDKGKYFADICSQIEESNRLGKTRDLFKKVKEITGKFTPHMGGVKSRRGKSIQEADDIKKRWREYVEELYSKDVSVTEPFEPTGFAQEPSVTEAEVRRAIHDIKSNKAPGIDNIPIELVRLAGEEGVKVITLLCQKIWQTGTWPEEWKQSVYIPIPKSGNAKECSNYRTIALISHTSKVLLKIIQGRMEQIVTRELPDVQAGFRKGRGTRDQIANVRWMWERAREYNQGVFLCFIDYSKAFDCVDHETMWNTLRRMGIPEHLISLLHNLYDKQTATVRTEHGDTEQFGIGKGVRQGCILSPMLFNLYAERVMREAGLEDSEVGVRVGGRVLNNLRYADDTTLAAETEEGLRKLIQDVTRASKKAGLHLNIKKTKVMSNAGITEFMVDGERIEVVKSFNLLGSIVEEEGTCRSELSRRLSLGRAAMTGLARIWKDRDLKITTKARLVRALVFPVAIYGCETWTLGKAQKIRLELSRCGVGGGCFGFHGRREERTNLF